MAGVAGVLAVVLPAWLAGDSWRGGPSEGGIWIWRLGDALGVAGALLVVAGLVGLYALLSERRGLVGAGAKVGFVLAVVAIGGYVGFWVYDLLARVSYDTSLLVLVSILHGYVRPVGYLLLGVAALWARALGRWRGSLLVVAVMSSPLPSLALYDLFFSEASTGLGTSVGMLAFQGPQVLADLGWIVLGLAMWNACKREKVLLAGDRRLIERRNLERARRLYVEAWGGGDLGIIDELVSPGIFDGYRGGKGRDGLKRSIADLRRSFPDLRFEIEAQEAEGDEVVTRWRMSGTDRGGVLWYPPTGKWATFVGTFTDRFSADGVIEHNGTSDRDALLAQLGLPRSD